MYTNITSQKKEPLLHYNSSTRQSHLSTKLKYNILPRYGLSQMSNTTFLKLEEKTRIVQSQLPTVFGQNLPNDSVELITLLDLSFNKSHHLCFYSNRSKTIYFVIFGLSGLAIQSSIPFLLFFTRVDFVSCEICQSSSSPPGANCKHELLFGTYCPHQFEKSHRIDFYIGIGSSRS